MFAQGVGGEGDLGRRETRYWDGGIDDDNLLFTEGGSCDEDEWDIHGFLGVVASNVGFRCCATVKLEVIVDTSEDCVAMGSCGAASEAVDAFAAILSIAISLKSADIGVYVNHS